MNNYVKPTFTKTSFVTTERIAKCSLTKGVCTGGPPNQENKPDGDPGES